MFQSIEIPRCKLPSGREVSIIDVLKFFYDLNETDVIILLKLSREGGKTLEELSQSISMSKASISRSISKLHSLGFISRKKITGKMIRGRPKYIYDIDREKVLRDILENINKCSEVAKSIIDNLFRSEEKTI
ncbi:MAG: helix-turn-helix domain-containing protein [Sulfolobales archaeon]